jgi:hypothetical protein
MCQEAIMGRLRILGDLVRMDGRRVVTMAIVDIEDYVRLPKAARTADWWRVPAAGPRPYQEESWLRVGYTAEYDPASDVVTFTLVDSTATEG